MENVEALKEKLVQEGFVHVFEWKDAPGTLYPAHKHKDRVAMYILEGGLTFNFDGEKIMLKKGDRFDAPPDKEHTAVVGPDGCHFLVGEMTDGDS